jgi:hypothetical protein
MIWQIVRQVVRFREVEASTQSRQNIVDFAERLLDLDLLQRTVHADPAQRDPRRSVPAPSLRAGFLNR